MMLTQEELIYLLNDSGARVAVLSRELMPHLAKMAEACPETAVGNLGLWNVCNL